MVKEVSAEKQEIGREYVEDDNCNDIDDKIILQQHFGSGKALICRSSRQVPVVSIFPF